MGMVLAKQGCIEEAIGYYLEALRANPKHVLAHLNMASVLAEQGRGRRNGSLLETLSMDPDSGAVYNGLGVVMALMQRLDESMYYLSRAVEISPDSPEGNSNFGRALTLGGEFRAAFMHLLGQLSFDQATPKPTTIWPSPACRLETSKKRFTMQQQLCTFERITRRHAQICIGSSVA